MFVFPLEKSTRDKFTRDPLRSILEQSLWMVCHVIHCLYCVKVVEHSPQHVHISTTTTTSIISRLYAHKNAPFTQPQVHTLKPCHVYQIRQVMTALTRNALKHPPLTRPLTANDSEFHAHGRPDVADVSLTHVHSTSHTQRRQVLDLQQRAGTGNI